MPKVTIPAQEILDVHGKLNRILGMWRVGNCVGPGGTAGEAIKGAMAMCEKMLEGTDFKIKVEQ